MGEVYAATDLRGPGPPVAIKVVTRLRNDPTLMQRLHREAEAAARIRSEYVPTVLEVSGAADAELFLVMERLIGEPLSQRMRDRGPLPWAEVLQYGEDILRGLIDAHIAGVVHRDLKPSNVFLAQKGGRPRAMVLDFGVCKLDTVDTQHLTGTGESIGTVAYMAPEQIRGASKVDDRADLYAFGVLVFEMTSGRLPHDGPSQMAILASKLENEAARIRDCARVAVPAGLDELVEKALSRDPSGRLTSAQELLKAWRKLGAPDVACAPAALADLDVPVMPSDYDPHDAPTALAHSHHAPTTHGSSIVPVEAHPTQTALTGGISLRKSGSSRVGVALAAFAVVAGGITVAAFFARAPRVGEGLPSESASALVDEPAPASSAASSAVEEQTTTPAALANVSEPAPENSTASTPKRPKGRGAHPTPRASGPHITSQPRY